MKHTLIILALMPLAVISAPFTIKHGDLSFSFDGESKSLLQTPVAEISIDNLWMLTFHDHPSVNASSF